MQWTVERMVRSLCQGGGGSVHTLPVPNREDRDALSCAGQCDGSVSDERRLRLWCVPTGCCSLSFREEGLCAPRRLSHTT